MSVGGCWGSAWIGRKNGGRAEEKIMDVEKEDIMLFLWKMLKTAPVVLLHRQCRKTNLDAIVTRMSLDSGMKPECLDTQTQGKHANSTLEGSGQICIHDLLAVIRRCKPFYRCGAQIYTSFFALQIQLLLFGWDCPSSQCVVGENSDPQCTKGCPRKSQESTIVSCTVWLFHIYEWYSGMQHYNK